MFNPYPKQETNLASLVVYKSDEKDIIKYVFTSAPYQYSNPTVESIEITKTWGKRRQAVVKLRRIRSLYDYENKVLTKDRIDNIDLFSTFAKKACTVGTGLYIFDGIIVGYTLTDKFLKLIIKEKDVIYKDKTDDCLSQSDYDVIVNHECPTAYGFIFNYSPQLLEERETGDYCWMDYKVTFSYGAMVKQNTALLIYNYDGSIDTFEGASSLGDVNLCPENDNNNGKLTIKPEDPVDFLSEEAVILNVRCYKNPIFSGQPIDTIPIAPDGTFVTQDRPQPYAEIEKSIAVNLTPEIASINDVVTDMKIETIIGNRVVSGFDGLFYKISGEINLTLYGELLKAGDSLTGSTTTITGEKYVNTYSDTTCFSDKIDTVISGDAASPTYLTQSPFILNNKIKLTIFDNICDEITGGEYPFIQYQDFSEVKLEQVTDESALTSPKLNEPQYGMPCVDVVYELPCGATLLEVRANGRPLTRDRDYRIENNLLIINRGAKEGIGTITCDLLGKYTDPYKFIRAYLIKNFPYTYSFKTKQWGYLATGEVNMTQLAKRLAKELGVLYKYCGKGKYVRLYDECPSTGTQDVTYIESEDEFPIYEGEGFEIYPDTIIGTPSISIPTMNEFAIREIESATIRQNCDTQTAKTKYLVKYYRNYTPQPASTLADILPPSLKALYAAEYKECVINERTGIKEKEVTTLLYSCRYGDGGDLGDDPQDQDQDTEKYYETCTVKAYIDGLEVGEAVDIYWYNELGEEFKLFGGIVRSVTYYAPSKTAKLTIVRDITRQMKGLLT